MSRCPNRLGVLLPLLLSLGLGACGGASDPREVEGSIRYMAEALRTDAPERLFRVIDARSRHAMVSIVKDRRAAADVIRRQYPEPERASALAQLGDAARADDAAALFAARCDSACRTTLAAKLAAPERVDGDELDVVVHTVRGATLHFHRLAPGDWWGLVWRTQELDTERARAAEERRTIEANAAVYERSRRLEREPASP
ncbi:MAG: hypothetical protein GXP55_08500 [Deltaproteobacteria bacterium]|nr:hypothetical protein [Deltaproteobacteria bacterium]